MNWRKQLAFIFLLVIYSLSSGSVYGQLQGKVRDLATDRPDATESPVTVDKGMFQIESSFMSYTRDKDNGIKSESFGYGEINFKYGISDNMDFQTIIVPWERNIEKTATTKTITEGISDITARLKYNVIGNDSGDFGFAVMPFVVLPSGTEVSTEKLQAGIILPTSLDLNNKWGIGSQIEFGRFYQDEGSHEWGLTHTVVLGYEVSESFGVYLEHITAVGDHELELSASFGGTYLYAENIQFDAGAMIGLTDSAPDLVAFSGFTIKF